MGAGTEDPDGTAGMEVGMADGMASTADLGMSTVRTERKHN